MAKAIKALWIGFFVLMMSASGHAKSQLIGAGATLPYPLYSKLFSMYSEKNNVKINYQPTGSGSGIMQLRNGTLDFGATDSFVTNKEMAQFNGQILHIPICIGSVAIIYNLKDITQLKLTADLLAGIFLGDITSWDDPKIKALNPNIKLPKQKIVPIRRADSSGTSYIFSHYLSSLSPKWKATVGEGMSVKWPVGAGTKFNVGVTNMVQDISGSIGYVSLPYAIENKVSVASIKNKSGQWISPTLKSTIASAKIKLPADSRVSITDTPVADGYPISGFTWIIVYKDAEKAKMSFEEAKDLKKLLIWMLTEGQVYADFMNYASLPTALVKPSIEQINKMVYKGQAIPE